MSKIHFEATPFTVHDWTLVLLPEEASAPLPSRGMLMGEGTLNGVPFQAPLEPDGRGSHWFKIESSLAKKAGVRAGSTVTVELEAIKDWPRPDMPKDIVEGIAKVPEAQALWPQITPAAQWEWLRWIRSTNNPATRAKRIEVSADKLRKGMRRPCCFNRNLCTEPYVAHNWQLIDPAQVTK